MADSRKSFRIDYLLAEKQKGGMNHSNKNLPDTCSCSLDTYPTLDA